MIEDKDTGKFFKDALEGYESPFDPNKMFDAIEDDLPKKKTSKRRAGFWIFGCAGLLGLMAVSALFLFQTTNAKIASNSDNKSTTQLSEHDSKHFRGSATSASRNTKNENSSTNIENENSDNSNIKTSIIENEYLAVTPYKIVHKEEDYISKNTGSSDSDWNLEDIQKSSIIPDVSNQNTPLTPKLEESKNKRSPLATISLLKILDAKLKRPSDSVLSNSFLISPYQKGALKKKKWEIGWSASYLMTSKNMTYSNGENMAWFENYLGSEKLHHAYDIGLNLSYHLDNHWYLIGSLSYLRSQESHSFTNEITESIYDDEIINTIFVDRDNNPTDTLFGANKIETTTQNHYLVTNLNLIGIGIGIGRSIELTNKWMLTTDVRIIPYLVQKSNGNIVDLNGILVDQSDFVLDGQTTNLNTSVLGTQFNLSLSYQLNPRWHIGLSGSMRYHLGNFSDSPFLTVNRNYYGGGLNIGLKF